MGDRLFSRQNAQRHQQVQVVVAVDAAQDHRLDRVTEFEAHLIGVDGVDTRHQVVRVEADHHLGAFVLHIDFLVDGPVVLIAHRQGQGVATQRQAHRRGGIALGHDLHPAQ